MAGFDPCDKASWYFGPMTREEANKIFKNVTEDGVFLVRESKTHRDDFVLCVKEGPKISHYIVTKVINDTGYVFKIGDLTFPDIPAMLTFYQAHFLDKTPLIKPVPREKVLAKYDFPGQDDEDLPFRKGEILEVITKEEERWWTARNRAGKIGQIPVPYVTEYHGNDSPLVPPHVPFHTHSGAQSIKSPRQSHDAHPHEHPVIDKPLPAKAVVIRNRIPNVFDKLQLKLNEGEIVTVTQINPDGKWWGSIGERQGYFPFTHIQFLEDGR